MIVAEKIRFLTKLFLSYAVFIALIVFCLFFYIGSIVDSNKAPFYDIISNSKALDYVDNWLNENIDDKEIRFVDLDSSMSNLNGYALNLDHYRFDWNKISLQPSPHQYRIVLFGASVDGKKVIKFDSIYFSNNSRIGIIAKRKGGDGFGVRDEILKSIKGRFAIKDSI